jgi:hypothetical protein
MGNSLFCNRNAEETVLQGQGLPHEPHDQVATGGKGIPRQLGANGLALYGFEYRRIRCRRHIKEHQTKELDEDLYTSEYCFYCATRLIHSESKTMVTDANCKHLIMRGKFFDDVSGCCQDIVQKRIQDSFDLQFVTIANRNELDEGPIQALVSPDLIPNKTETTNDDAMAISKPILVIIGGKGKSRAGVLSVKQLLVSGIEKGSAIFHIIQALQRGFSVMILDPNARGETKGKETIDRSLSFFFDDNIDDNQAPASIYDQQLYVLAHSAAGGFLARYLYEGRARQALMQRIRCLVLTDSTHNIQWIKQDPSVYHFLQSSKCLYIRNTSENPSETFANHRNKKAGEAHEANVWWHHRFGDIPTVWAGTPEHSLMCWVARNVIWDFYAEDKYGVER